MALRTKYSS